MASSGGDDAWPTDAESYDFEGLVGRGAFAQVYRATCVSRRRAAVAVKVMDLEQISTSLEDIRQEVQTMRLAQHENVLGLHVAFVKRRELYLVMPLKARQQGAASNT